MMDFPRHEKICIRFEDIFFITYTNLHIPVYTTIQLKYRIFLQY